MFKKFNCAFLDIHWLDFHDDKPKLDKKWLSLWYSVV